MVSHGVSRIGVGQGCARRMWKSSDVLVGGLRCGGGQGLHDVVHSVV